MLQLPNMANKPLFTITSMKVKPYGGFASQVKGRRMSVEPTTSTLQILNGASDQSIAGLSHQTNTVSIPGGWSIDRLLAKIHFTHTTARNMRVRYEVDAYSENMPSSSELLLKKRLPPDITFHVERVTKIPMIDKSKLDDETYVTISPKKDDRGEDVHLASVTGVLNRHAEMPLSMYFDEKDNWSSQDVIDETTILYQGASAMYSQGWDSPIEFSSDLVQAYTHGKTLDKLADDGDVSRRSAYLVKGDVRYSDDFFRLMKNYSSYDDPLQFDYQDLVKLNPQMDNILEYYPNKMLTFNKQFDTDCGSGGDLVSHGAATLNKEIPNIHRKFNIAAFSATAAGKVDNFGREKIAIVVTYILRNNGNTLATPELTKCLEGHLRTFYKTLSKGSEIPYVFTCDTRESHVIKIGLAGDQHSYQEYVFPKCGTDLLSPLRMTSEQITDFSSNLKAIFNFANH